MSRNTRGAGAYLVPILSDGTEAGSPAAAGNGRGWYTLAAGTYYVALDGVSQSTLESVHFQWSSALIGVITFEDSNMGESDVALTSTTSGEWIPENPSDAVVSVTGTGASATAATITLAGGGAGGGMAHLGNLGSGRMRAKLVISTGGAVRVAPVGKD